MQSVFIGVAFSLLFQVKNLASHKNESNYLKFTLQSASYFALLKDLPTKKKLRVSLFF
jgi:hypothetical protein